MVNLQQLLTRPTFGPLEVLSYLWPDVELYDKQREMVLSVRDSVETIVVAGNQLGKDFVAGYICLSFFLWPMLYFSPKYVAEVESFRTPKNDPHTRRIITTSVASYHLAVLWAEIGWWARTCKQDLFSGSEAILMLDKQIRFVQESGVEDERNLRNYMKGQVSAKGEGMAGHHAMYTLGVVDEASGMDDEVYDRFRGWTKRRLLFGNPEACENRFKEHYKAGDLLAV